MGSTDLITALHSPQGPVAGGRGCSRALGLGPPLPRPCFITRSLGFYSMSPFGGLLLSRSQELDFNLLQISGILGTSPIFRETDLTAERHLR